MTLRMTAEVMHDVERHSTDTHHHAGHCTSRLCSCEQHGAERERVFRASLGRPLCCCAARGVLPLARRSRSDRGRGPAAGWSEERSESSDNAPAGTVVVSPSDVLMERGGTTNASAPATEETTQGADARVILDAHLDVRMTRREHDAIKHRADVLGVKASTWARAVLRDALDARSHEVEVLAAQAAVPKPSPEFARAVEQFRRVGVNLNQALRAGKAVNDELLRDVLAAVNSVRASFGDEVSL